MSDTDRELDELLGAYALDAVSPDERRAVDDYLAINARARQEVAEHREVATMLAWSGAAAPDGLWDRIASQLDGVAPAPSGALADVLAAAPAPTTAANVIPITAAPRQRWVRRAGAWAMATAAAAVVAVLVVTSVVDRADPRSPLAAAVDEARADRDTRTAVLRSADGVTVGEVVIDQDGHGYIVADGLPVLSADRTYQVWGVIGDQVISLGVIGRAPEIEPFSADAPISQVVITNEVAGGVVSNGNPDGAYAGEVS